MPPHLLPVKSSVSPRFGITQNSKVRPIDDCTFSLLNSLHGAHEKLQFQDVVSILSICKCIVTSRPGRLLGRTWDLEKPYRQLAIHPADRKWTHIAIYHPDLQSCQVHEMCSLPFGASSSVFSFTRLALELNRAGCMIFKFLWSKYLDDYAVFSNAILQKACETTINAFFHILGIQTSKSNEKCVSFAEVFDCLGITFLLHETPDELFVQNTSKRCTELCMMITNILLADSLSFKESQSLRSRLFFAEQNLFGRLGMATLKSLLVYESVNLLQPIPQHLRSMLSAMRQRLTDNQPRPVPLSPRKTWHVHGWSTRGSHLHWWHPH